VLHERLWRAWSVQKRSVPISPAMYFSPDGLALGAGTILLPAVGLRRLADLQGEEARLLTLLAATYGKAISPSVLGYIKRAAQSWHEGDDMAALDHLVDAGLPLPADPAEEARRLFITDAFVKAGTHPLAILHALGLDGAYVETVAKLYNELEPRVPAGNSTLSGRWTRALSFLGDLTATQIEQLGLWAARLLAPIAPEAAGAVAAAGLLVFPSPNRIRVNDDIKGLPGGRYFWNRDETEIHITYKDADGEEHAVTARRKAQEFLDWRGRVVGRVLPGDAVVIDTDALPGKPASDEPKLCPLPKPDKRTNDRGLAYEAFMRPLVNPGMPTPLGFAYYLPDQSGKAVEFDDCQQTTGRMIDYKDRYWKMLSDLGIQQFLLDRLWEQAERQVEAAGDRPIRWYFSEEKAADYIRYLFRGDSIRGRIEIVHVPMPESAR
jgi:hypothetical protein